MKSKKQFRPIVSFFTLTFLAIQGASQRVYALPYSGANLSQLVSHIDLTGVGEVIGDSENKHVVYVKPGEKSFNGRYSQLGGNLDCRDLINFARATYKMPANGEISEVLKANQFYSPAFEATIGVAGRNSNLTYRMIEKRKEYETFNRDHKEELGAYLATTKELEFATKMYEDIKRISKETVDLYYKQRSGTDDQAEKAEIRADYLVKIKKIDEQEAEAYQNLNKAKDKNFEAYMKWQPYEYDYKWLKTLTSDLDSSFDNLQRIAKNSLDASEKLLHTMQSKAVGIASVSFSLSNESEIELLNKKIYDYNLNLKNEYEAKIQNLSEYEKNIENEKFNLNKINSHALGLEVFNVSLNPGVMITTRGFSDESIGINYSLVTYNLPLKTRITLGTESFFAKLPSVTIEKDEDQDKKTPMQFLLTNLNGSFGGSQSMNMPVTQGAVCGHPVTTTKGYEYKSEDGSTHNGTVTTMEYNSPPENQAIFSQDVALKYNYYAKSDPIDGSCELKVRETSEFTRNAGTETHWNWFSKHTNSWDDTKNELDNNMGLKCELKKRPQGNSPEESQALNDSLEKLLYQDMFHMFVISYAKDFKTIPLSPPAKDSEESKLFSKLGVGIMGLCGNTPYCEISGLVLKTLDELVGQRHSGTSSNYTRVSGTLRKQYDIDTYYMAEGTSNIKLRVCVDHNKCN